jgi:hypothetical protein
MYNFFSVLSFSVHSCCSMYSYCSVHSYVYVLYIQSQNRKLEGRKFIIGLHFVFCEQKYSEIWIRSRNSLCSNVTCIYEVTIEYQN